MSRRRVIWSVIAAGTLIVMGIGAFLSVRLLGGDEPAEAALTSPSGGASQAGSSTESRGSAEGTWRLDTTTGSLEDGSATFAGYRIDEQVAGIGANTAVGRTRDVAGELGIEGTSITSLTVEVDMSTLKSDDDRRDDQLRVRGLETDRYPTAQFVLTEAIPFDDEPQEGETVTAEAVGELTIHGVTREVTVPVEARWTGDAIEVVAAFDVALSDHEIEAPTGFLVLSADDQGTVELHLLFERA
jgi:polyisoprenoid-binding protein YceI